MHHNNSNIASLHLTPIQLYTFLDIFSFFVKICHDDLTCANFQSIWVKGMRKHAVKDITTPAYPWQPMLVLANRKSGDNQGQSVLQMFRHLLNPVQVIFKSVVQDNLFYNSRHVSYHSFISTSKKQKSYCFNLASQTEFKVN